MTPPRDAFSVTWPLLCVTVVLLIVLVAFLALRYMQHYEGATRYSALLPLLAE